MLQFFRNAFAKICPRNEVFICQEEGHEVHERILALYRYQLRFQKERNGKLLSIALFCRA